MGQSAKSTVGGRSTRRRQKPAKQEFTEATDVELLRLWIGISQLRETLRDGHRLWKRKRLRRRRAARRRRAERIT